MVGSEIKFGGQPTGLTINWILVFGVWGRESR